jgi:hypothetical protein
MLHCGWQQASDVTNMMLCRPLSRRFLAVAVCPEFAIAQPRRPGSLNTGVGFKSDVKLGSVMTQQLRFSTLIR